MSEQNERIAAEISGSPQDSYWVWEDATIEAFKALRLAAIELGFNSLGSVRDADMGEVCSHALLMLRKP